jgi:DNA-binding NarL/FixJ family response regulator
MTISVAVADDQALVRVGFCGIVAATPGLAVVGEAANGAEAVAVARSAGPDILLMDVRMPVLNGIDATRQITSAAESSGVRVIILTTFDLDEYVFGALRAGASGFLLKDTLPEDLITAIRVVAAGEALLAPSITRRLISEFARTPALGVPGPAAAGLPAYGGGGTQAAGAPGAAGALHPRRGDKVTGLLTDRECEVLRLVAAGMSNGEIADHLRISPATAKTHLAHLLTKLDARDRVQLVIIAYQAGLVPAGSLTSHGSGKHVAPPSRSRVASEAGHAAVRDIPRLDFCESRPLVAEGAPIVLEDEADGREHHGHETD